MKMLLVATMLFAASASHAQGPKPDTAPGGPAAGSTGQFGAPNWQPGKGGTEGGTATGDLTNKSTSRLSSDDQKALRATIAAKKIPSVTLSDVFARGKDLPKDIQTHAIDSDARYGTLRFAHVNNQFLLINNSGTIVEVID
ncbi:MAG: hypothetical protein BGP04_03365 [Rhizobiales bacterium 62-17]|nr:hypothetical protein [Hyphomicrobiales bacterium]OJY04448.1 MAG: hypothetical protein BGP04_03365 [Rhizobiales bacterium 62-17]